jgi:hypothetical protein
MATAAFFVVMELFYAQIVNKTKVVAEIQTTLMNKKQKWNLSV